MATANKRKAQKQPRSVFAFDLHKPLFKGNLLKQGEFHRAFKDRFFVLYPGFIVYYDSIRTWQYDLQRGETLGSRLNAFKLKGGSVDKAKNPPRGAKYAFVLNAPDPSNKRHLVMFNAKSNEERYQWMVKIRLAIPGKENSKESSSKEPASSKGAEETKTPVPEPSEKSVEEPTKNTTVNNTEEKPAAENTTKVPTEDESSATASEDKVQSTEDATKDSIDGVLGPRSTINSTSSVGSAVDLSSPIELSPEHKHDPNSQTEADSGIHTDSSSPGDISVVSSVTIEVNQDQKGTQPTPTLASSQSLDVPAEGEGVKRDSTMRVTDSSEIVIPAQNGSRLSITITEGSPPFSDGDDDDEDSDDSEGLSELPPTDRLNEIPPSETVSSPPATSSSSQPESSNNGSPTPQIAVELIGDDNRQPNSSASPPALDVVKKDEFNPPSPTPDRRRPSGVSGFIEKRGYLYKQGGKHKTWHLRYFVLQPGMFTYFKNDPNKGKALGEVKLSKRTKIYIPKSGEKKYSSFQFTVYSPSAWNKRSTYCIAANNEREMKDWIEAFKHASGVMMDSPEH